MNNKAIGELSEQIVITELLRRGVPVSKPIGDNQRYDVIIELHGTLYKCQVKTGRRKNGSLVADVVSNRLNTKGSRKIYYDRTQIDFFLICDQIDNSVYIIDVDECPNTQVAFRLKPSNARNKTSIREAKHYNLDSFMGM